MDVMGFKVHPAAEIFPLLSDDELEALKDDIEENGQRRPIVLWCEQVVDGRNRLRACESLGINPLVEHLSPETDPVSYVLSINLHRRHLHPSQRAMIAAKLATLPHGGDRKSENIKAQNCALIDEAAELLTVSPRSVDSAKHVLERGATALVEAVEAKQINVSLAEKLCRACPSKRQQAKLLQEGKQAIRDFLNPPVHLDDCEDETDEHQYDAAVMKVWSQCDYRLNTLHRIFATLEPHEKQVVCDWLRADGNGQQERTT